LGVRGKWVAKIQEYNLEIRPTKLIKGQGLSQMMAEGNEVSLGMKEEPCPVIFVVIQELEQHYYYVDIICFLKNLTSLDHKKNIIEIKGL
jgi:hypothetical protein